MDLGLLHLVVIERQGYRCYNQGFIMMYSDYFQKENV